MKRILVIGNSHSCDAFWQLQEVFKAEAPEEQVLLGVLYYSGCRISQHIQFAQEHKSVYNYYRNCGEDWESFKEVPMEVGLQDQPWDIIFLQPAGPQTEYEKASRDQLAQIVAEYVKTPYRLMWHQAWPVPNDETFYAPTYDPQPPATFRARMEEAYGFDIQKHAQSIARRNVELVLGDPMFEKFISTFAAITHALWVSGIPQTTIYRDYAHLQDYGRLIAAYAIFAQLMDREITEVKVNSIAAGLRHRRARVLGDMEVTDDLRQVVIDAVKYAQAHPWEVPTAS